MKFQRKTIILFILLLFTWFSPNAHATNIHYLEGDAFFQVQIWKGNMQKLNKKSPILSYDRFTGGRFCGHAGYGAIKLHNLPISIRKNLLYISSKILKQYPRKTKLNRKIWGSWIVGVIGLIYNKRFNHNTHRFGLYYNKNWLVQLNKFGKRKWKKSHRALNFPKFYKLEKVGLKTAIHMEALPTQYQNNYQNVNWGRRYKVRLPKDGLIPRMDLIIRGKNQGLSYAVLDIKKHNQAYYLLQSTNIKEYIKQKQGLVFYRITEKIEKYRRQGSRWVKIKVIKRPRTLTGLKCLGFS